MLLLRRINFNIIVKNIIIFSSVLIYMLFGNNSIAQEVEIRLGENNIALNEYFTITLSVKNGKIKSYSGFPEIRGFDKRGVSNQSSTNIINGRMSQELKLVQNYQARKEGKFTLPAFEIAINGVAVPNNGTSILVGPAKQRQQSNNWDPFADFFGRNRNSQPQEFIEVKDDAFFAISTDKKNIYIGEGFNIDMSFYVAENNRAQMDFHDLTGQLNNIIKKIKPAGCWEENFEIQEIKPEVIEINNKRYTKYQLYSSTFYPLNDNDIKIPSVPWKMVKYKVSKQQSFFGRNHKKDFKTYYSKQKNIKVKPLPPHPLKDQVSVGSFKLYEGVSKDSFETGESFNYQFSIAGEGNIAGIKAPMQKDFKGIQIYDPNEMQDISRSNGHVVGKKTFDYYMIPEEPGNYNVGDFFKWIYFNVKTSKYDTLASNAAFKVVGESAQNSAIQSSDLGSYYDRIPFEETKLVERKEPFDIYIIVQLITLAALSFTTYSYFKSS